MKVDTVKIKPAKYYNPVNDICLITCFYNSNAYKSKTENYNTFIQKIDLANLNYITVECAFGKQPFSLKKSPNIIQLRTKDIMWQKERLLNIALENVPNKFKKIIWVDCDVLFENPDWAKETSILLNQYKIVQPFKDAIRLPKDHKYYKGTGERYESFGYVLKNNPYIIEEGKFNLHGHTGFAWAGKRSVFQKYGFYDACIAGSGDHMMAHAFVGDWDTACVKRVIGNNDAFYKHYIDWSEKIYPKVKSSIGYTEGVLLHLWHGDVENRNYVIRQRFLEDSNFNPYNDIKLNDVQCWEWNHKNEVLKKWAKEYFILRKEDGN